MENRKRIESYLPSDGNAQKFGAENVVYVREPEYDEIDLREIIRNLFSEWKFFLLVMVCGLLLSVMFAFYLSRSFSVEAIIRLPSVDMLGDIGEQNLLALTPEQALARVVDQVTAPDNQLKAFASSSLYTELAKGSELTPMQIFSSIRRVLSVSRVKHAYYELAKTEKTPFKEVKVSIVSSSPELAAEYIKTLVDYAQKQALSHISNDISATKNNQLKVIQKRLNFLSSAAASSRKAEIKRLQEINNEAIARLRLQIELQLSNAKKKRENQIIQVQEALVTARALEIVDPVTWDDLRSSRKLTQITNEFGSKDKTEPRYFQGTRILAAELSRLSSRQSDRPFLNNITDIEKQIAELENDPKIVMLEQRQDDSIYIEKYDELQRQLSEIAKVPTVFQKVQLAHVSQQPTISPQPTRNPYLIIILGVMAFGIFAFIATLIKASLKNSRATKLAT